MQDCARFMKNWYEERFGEVITNKEATAMAARMVELGRLMLRWHNESQTPDNRVKELKHHE
jgi:hypothetical protein